MKYRLKIAEEIIDVEVALSEGERSARFSIGEKEYHVRYQDICLNNLHLIVNGKSTAAFVAPGDRGKHIFVNGRSFLVQDVDLLTAHRARRHSLEETPHEVTPPMPAIVVRIMVEEGDVVKRGQGLVVVTAMKMETTLVAPSNGRVAKINTSIGEKVAPGDILVEIEEEVLKDD
ncbi:MAG TPA: biotin/lipoyl-containing protein [Acidobacteriota bacterium]|nr:biotin/lipoyl-containing protein [Acidobacteriota bacterium]